MSTDQNNTGNNNDQKLPPAQTGNASNPSENDPMEPAGNNQLLDDKAEKYLREVASIEDYPDAQDQQDMDDAIKKEKADQ